MSTKLPRYSITMHGLSKWYKKSFEKFGWMILAKAKGKDYKVTAYKKSLLELVLATEHLMSEYKDEDKLHDLNIIHMHSVYLINYVKKHL